MDLEIQRQLAEYDRKHLRELNAIVLWVLHDKFGFGYERLKRFYDGFMPAMEALIKRYELDDEDAVWLCTHKLREECGVDLEEWEKEHES